MNKKITLILLVICLLGVFSLSAQKPVRSFLSLNASTASTGQIRFTSHYNFSPFFGGSENLGIGYQLYANHFTFSIGTEIGASAITNFSKEPITIGKKTIPEGTLELLGNGHMNFPVMIGGEFNKFYFKLGVVPAYNILNAATIIGPVLNPEDPHPYKTTKKLLYQNPFQLYGRVEIGGSFGGKNDFAYLTSAQAALAAWNKAVQTYPEHLGSAANRAFFLWRSAMLTELRVILDLFSAIFTIHTIII